MPTPDVAAQRAVLDRVASLEREQAVLYARQARARAEMAQLWGADQGVVLELAGTARIGQQRAGGQLDRGAQLVHGFPVALGLLEHGVMRVGTVEVLLNVTRQCSRPVQQLLDARLSEQLCQLDAVDVRRRVLQAVPEVEAEVEAGEQEHRFERARADRGVWVMQVEDGMARIGAEVEQLAARRWALDFEELVRAEKVLDARTGVTRTQAQRRADVFAELPSRLLALADAAARGRLEELLSEAPSREPQPDTDELVTRMLALELRKPVTLHVHVPMSTLLDLDQRSGWLEGYGPVPAMRARMLLPCAALRRVGVDERTGIPLGTDAPAGPEPPWDGEMDLHPAAAHQRTHLFALLGPMYVTDQAEPQHDPSTALRRLVQLRDQTCDGPGCPRSASACELDHEQDHALGGPTAEWNLRHRSTRCHHAKHAGWTVTRDADTGASTWTSPAGSVYERHTLWQAPTELPPDLVLPEPRPAAPKQLTDCHDGPLWHEPERRAPRTPRRGVDPDDVDDQGDRIPKQGRPAAGTTSWDDGPPPF
ncbi:MAG TPA: DUF222 domain-containing protein [Mycobacteriales bacterium]|nr:DUF222 domain-containing protein [Mycobacteriales bacterium]